MLDRDGWQRRSERPRELPAVRLLDEATTLLATAPEAASPTQPLPGGGSAAAIERIERLVQQELDAEEAVRTRLGRLPRPPADAERVARTLATLTQTLHALQRLRCGVGAQSAANDYDDMPEDIDAFRIELARRIEAFFETADLTPADLLAEAADALARGEPAEAFLRGMKSGGTLVDPSS